LAAEMKPKRNTRPKKAQTNGRFVRMEPRRNSALIMHLYRKFNKIIESKKKDG
jgi:hypothetical protein